jgi:hypothetical protein
MDASAFGHCKGAATRGPVRGPSLAQLRVAAKRGELERVVDPSIKAFGWAAAVILGVMLPVGVWMTQTDGLHLREHLVAARIADADRMTAPRMIDADAPVATAPRAPSTTEEEPVDAAPSAVDEAPAASAPAPAEARPAFVAGPPTRAAAPAQVVAGVRCGRAVCGADQDCCNESCGICVARGGTCTNKICGRPELPASASCGQNTCNVGQVCCNRSCGICTKPGATCSRATCDGPIIPSSAPCGMNTCNVGEVCCNASCGVCTKPGGSCKQDLCG